MFVAEVEHIRGGVNTWLTLIPPPPFVHPLPWINPFNGNAERIIRSFVAVESLERKYQSRLERGGRGGKWA